MVDKSLKVIHQDNEFAIVKFFAKRYWLRLFVLTTFIIVSVGITLIQPLILKYLIDNFIHNKSIQKFAFCVIIMVLVGCLSVLINYLRATTSSYIINKIQLEIRSIMFEKLLYQPLGYYSKRNLGEITQRVLTDVHVVNSIFGFLFQRFISSSLILTGAVIVLLNMSWQVTIASLISVGMYVLVFKAYNEKLRDGYLKTRECMDDVSSELQETYIGIRDIKAFQYEHNKQSSFMDKLKKLFSYSYHLDKQSAVAHQLCYFFTIIGPLVVFFIGGIEVLRGIISVGTLIAIYSYVIKLYDPAMDVSDAALDLKKFLISIRRIAEILDLDAAEKETAGKPELPEKIKGEVVFDNVHFAYDEKIPVLNGLSLTLCPGKMVALVGATGGGKTTCANLMLGFFKNQKGRILIDGNDINQISIRSLRKHLSLVPQDPFMFNVSIYENIHLGNPKATPKEIEQVIKFTQIEEFIKKLPNGLNTIVGERGANLSGGQKQRIAIARALLKNSEIIIFDEATSAIDVNTETAIHETLNRIKAHKTLLVIGHRLSTVMIADEILVVKDGSVVEIGTHEQLLKTGTEYKKIFGLS